VPALATVLYVGIANQRFWLAEGSDASVCSRVFRLLFRKWHGKFIWPTHVRGSALEFVILS